jgi:hypothetical protein
MNIFRFPVLLSILLISPAGFSAAPPVDSRADFLGKLIDNSSGAQQVLKSDDPEVKALHLKAKDLFSQAKNAFKLGNNSEGSALLNQSAKSMFMAIRLATPTSAGDAKLKLDFDKRKDSVNTLNEAFNRIADEQKAYSSSKKTNKQLGELMTKAGELQKNGKHVQAKKELDKAYHLIKVSIESLRGGQTLVRSLNFATPEEEYDYEIDRNNTHKMLVKLLLNGKNSSAYVQEMVTKFTHSAKLLRIQAEQSAQDEKYEDAIKLLEQSTKQLVRSIRSAGIYIPG